MATGVSNAKDEKEQVDVVAERTGIVVAESTGAGGVGATGGAGGTAGSCGRRQPANMTTRTVIAHHARMASWCEGAPPRTRRPASIEDGDDGARAQRARGRVPAAERHERAGGRAGADAGGQRRLPRAEAAEGLGQAGL